MRRTDSSMRAESLNKCSRRVVTWARARVVRRACRLISCMSQAAGIIQDKAKGAVRIEGHTDSKGDDTYNQKLSERRTRRPKKSGASLVDRKSKEPFAIAIFNGPVGKNSVPAYFAEGWDLGDGGLFVGEGGVIAGPFESDNCVILRPRGKKYVIK